LLVGIEGAWGLLMYAIILPIISLIPVSFVYMSLAPNKGPQGRYYIERPDNYFKEAASDPLLGSMCIIGVLSVAVFNMCGISVTKFISALVRSIVDVTRTMLVWIIGLIISSTT